MNTAVMSPPGSLMSIEELCRDGGFSRVTAYSVIRKYGLPVVKIGRLSRIKRKEWEALKERLTTGVGDAPVVRGGAVDADLNALA